VRRGRRLLAALAVAGGLTTLPGADASAEEVYVYDVRHPVYGQIGTYTDTVARTEAGFRLETRLEVAVRLLGIVFHRETAHYNAVWDQGRLTSFRGVTTTNGATVELRGDAVGNVFVLTAPAGTREIPGDVVPSSPWFAKVGPGTLMSTKTGRIYRAHCTDLGDEVITLHGVALTVRHFDLVTDNRQEAWLGKAGVPMRFRSWESGTPIDFELTPDALRGLGFTPSSVDVNPPTRGN
jgi:hypothetical protein